VIKLNINGKHYELDVPKDMPLLWAVRDVLGFSGAKFGCGMGLCGACTMHLEGQAIRSCVTPVSAAVGKPVTTIEGIAADTVGQQVQKTWVDVGVAQCGFCQGGQIMSATALLKGNPNPGNTDIEMAMGGNICRCGTYNRIKTAIHQAAAQIQEAKA
tara:strand:+ start:23078 stop:23548 length:471 start_codon:yes stop_codon:yes gene_type:complete